MYKEGIHYDEGVPHKMIPTASHLVKEISTITITSLLTNIISGDRDGSSRGGSSVCDIAMINVELIMVREWQTEMS